MGWTRSQLGYEVDLPEGQGTTILTVQMLESGLDAVTEVLADTKRGNHYSVKGIARDRRRLPSGSRGVWASRLPIALYKIINAARVCGLAVLIFDLAQKMKCVARAPAAAHAHALAACRVCARRRQRRQGIALGLAPALTCPAPLADGVVLASARCRPCKRCRPPSSISTSTSLSLLTAAAPPLPSSPPPLLPSFLRLHVRRPDEVRKLMLGLEHGGVTLVDYALELPGLFYVRRGGDAEASRRPRRLAVDSFFLSQHDHAGGTFKYYGPSSEFKRAHLQESNRKPTHAEGLSYRALAREIAKYQRQRTIEDLHYLRAPILKSATLYHGDHHRTAPILSNSLAETLDGTLAHFQEVREAQREVGATIDEHSPDAPSFSMRFELRFFGCGIEEALLEDPADEASGETRAGAALELMQNLTSIFYWYMFEIWDLELAHVPEISAPELIAPSSFHLAMAEATLALAVQEFSINSAATSLSHLALDAHLRVQGHICNAVCWYVVRVRQLVLLRPLGRIRWSVCSSV